MERLERQLKYRLNILKSKTVTKKWLLIINNLTVITWIIKRALTGSIPDKSYATFFCIRLCYRNKETFAERDLFL